MSKKERREHSGAILIGQFWVLLPGPQLEEITAEEGDDPEKLLEQYKGMGMWMPADPAMTEEMIHARWHKQILPTARENRPHAPDPTIWRCIEPGWIEAYEVPLYEPEPERN